MNSFLVYKRRVSQWSQLQIECGRVVVLCVYILSRLEFEESDGSLFGKPSEGS